METVHIIGYVMKIKILNLADGDNSVTKVGDIVTPACVHDDKVFLFRADQRDIASGGSDCYEHNTHWIVSRGNYLLMKEAVGGIDVADYLSKVDQYIAQGYIKATPYPDKPDIVLYTYTGKCYRDNKWDDLIQNSEILVIDKKEKQIVLRGLPKMSSLSDVYTLPNEKPIIEDCSGDTILMGKYNDYVYTVSREGFDTDNINEMRGIRGYNANNYLLEGRTYVMRYPKPFRPVLSTVVINSSGLEHSDYDFFYSTLAISMNGLQRRYILKVDYTDTPDLISQLEDIMTGNSRQGVQLRYVKDRLRVYIPSKKYAEQRQLEAQMTSRLVWSKLKEHGADADIVRKIGHGLPKDIKDKAEEYAADLAEQYYTIEDECQNYYEELLKKLHPAPTKSYAVEISNHKYKKILFDMLKGRKHEDNIWQLVKPKTFQLVNYANSI